MASLLQEKADTYIRKSGPLSHDLDGEPSQVIRPKKYQSAERIVLTAVYERAIRDENLSSAAAAFATKQTHGSGRSFAEPRIGALALFLVDRLSIVHLTSDSLIFRQVQLIEKSVMTMNELEEKVAVEVIVQFIEYLFAKAVMQAAPVQESLRERERERERDIEEPDEDEEGDHNDNSSSEEQAFHRNEPQHIPIQFHGISTSIYE
ncbi:hypothetical protein QQP08_019678 [Theobroma cacao]|nr:hypothetical protein QQP08_019678 [Theobroma cacao]